MAAVAVLIVSSLLVPSSVVVCDAWGWPMTRLHGDGAEYIDPPPFSVELSPGCFEVPWSAS